MIELEYLLTALQATLEEKPLSPPPAELDFSAFFRQAELHGLAPMLAETMTSLGEAVPTGIQRQFQDALRRNKVRIAKQKIALEEISEALTQRRIRFLPLKGCVLQDYYPKASMRLMSDLDILIDTAQAARVREAMESLGYTTQEYMQGNHDVYFLQPILNVEMHRELTDPTEVDYTYLLGAWDRALPDAEGSYSYHMTHEDFYIFHISHLAKHLLHEQVTARQVADLWILLRRFRDTYDWAYIQEELDKAGLMPFGEHIRRLACCWFGQEAWDPFLQELSRHILEQRENFTGFGNVELALQYSGQTGRGVKFRYTLRRIFLPLSSMQTLYPVLKQVPVLLPVFWPVRWCSLLFFHRDRVRTRLQQDKNMDPEKARAFHDYMKKLGLK